MFFSLIYFGFLGAGVGMGINIQTQNEYKNGFVNIKTDGHIWNSKKLGTSAWLNPINICPFFALFSGTFHIENLSY